MAHAAACPPGTNANTDDGRFYDRGVECTPQNEGGGRIGDGTPEGGGSIRTPSDPPKGPTITLINPLGPGTDLPTLVSKILAFVVRIGAIIVTFMLIFVGYKFVVARGEPGKISEARQNLMWTIVGALILLGAQAIAIAIEQTVRAISSGG